MLNTILVHLLRSIITLLIRPRLRLLLLWSSSSSTCKPITSWFSLFTIFLDRLGRLCSHFNHVTVSSFSHCTCPSSFAATCPWKKLCVNKLVLLYKLFKCWWRWSIDQSPNCTLADRVSLSSHFYILFLASSSNRNYGVFHYLQLRLFPSLVRLYF